SNNWRSIREYSQVPEETTGGGCSDCGDIVAFPPPAQHKGTPPAALYSVTVDLLPEGHKIINGREQRRAHHHPNRRQSDRVDRQIEEVPWQVRPVVVDNGSHHRDNLHQHLALAQLTGLNRKPFRR